MTQPTRSSRQNRPSLAQAATASPAASSPATEPADDIVTDLLQRVLGKNPATTVVTIDEVDMDNWGIGGLPVGEFRAAQAQQETQR